VFVVRLEFPIVDVIAIVVSWDAFLLKRRVFREVIVIEVRRAIDWGGASALVSFAILGSTVKIGENRNPDEGSNRFISVFA
jgi:hypothetical protein